jgi:hypothetical protein
MYATCIRRQTHQGFTDDDEIKVHDDLAGAVRHAEQIIVFDRRYKGTMIRMVSISTPSGMLTMERARAKLEDA